MGSTCRARLSADLPSHVAAAATSVYNQPDFLNRV